MRMVEDSHQLSNDVLEALHEPCILAFQLGQSLLGRRERKPHGGQFTAQVVPCDSDDGDRHER